jgi:two-component system, NarL family, sensor kinase
VASSTGSHWAAVHDGTTQFDALRGFRIQHGRWASWLVPAIYSGCLIAFVADLMSSNTLAFGVFYTPLVATAVFHRDKRAVWYLTAIACGMDIVGSFFPTIAFDVDELMANRSLSICAILATAAFVWHARSIQDQLTEQTSRAEAAERIKTEVLTNITQEIRGPLYSMIGVIELVASDSRPEQKAALGMVRTAARRLVTTVDNLVDLTQFDGRSMIAEPFDLGMLLRQTVEARRQDAVARQIELTINIPSRIRTIALASPWGARRILENKIADAIIYTAPGGKLVVGLETGDGKIAVVVTASGSWPAGALQAASDTNAAPLIPSVMGMALSQRLARAMDAQLVFSGEPGGGTTARLTLPSAVETQAGC